MTSQTYIAFIVACSITLYGCQDEATASQDAAKPTPEENLNARAQRVEVLEIAPRTNTLTLMLPGEVEGARDAFLSSATGGYVEKVLVEQGDAVRKGADLAWVNKSIADAQLSQAQAQLDIAAHDLNVVKAAGESVSRSRKVKAEAQYKIAESNHIMARLQADRSRMRAPFKGVIAAANLERGEVAAPGTPLLRLVHIDTVKVSVSISDRDVQWVKPGVAAQIFLDGGAKALTATVSRVTPAADLETRTFIAEIDVPNTDRSLMPGMMATTKIESTSKGESLVIPQYALLTRREGNGVFVVQDGKATWRPLEVRTLMGHELIIDSGIQAGDNVIIKGHRELNHGDDVMVVRNAPDTKSVSTPDKSEVDQ